MNPLNWTESQRAYAYRVVLALMPLLTAYGLLEGDDVLLWTQVANAVLGIGASALATHNTSTDSDAP